MRRFRKTFVESQVVFFKSSSTIKRNISITIIIIIILVISSSSNHHQSNALVRLHNHRTTENLTKPIPHRVKKGQCFPNFWEIFYRIMLDAHWTYYEGTFHPFSGLVLISTGCVATILTRKAWLEKWFSRWWFDHTVGFTGTVAIRDRKFSIGDTIYFRFF